MISLSFLLRIKKKNISYKRRGEFKTHILHWITVFFFKSCLYLNMWQNIYSRTGHRRKYGASYKIQPNMCNNYCFSTITAVAGTCLNITSYVSWLSCFDMTWEDTRLWQMFYYVLTQHQYIIINTLVVGYMFRVLSTILRPLFTIWRYIQCAHILWDLMMFT